MDTAGSEKVSVIGTFTHAKLGTVINLLWMMQRQSLVQGIYGVEVGIQNQQPLLPWGFS
jgi:hypothetical protein